jgi:serine/threonine-protein kinase RsbW
VAELRFTFDPKEQKKEDFFVELRRFAAENQWLPQIANEVELIFEEWLTNVLDYGLRKQGSPQIRITIRAEGGRVQMEIRDNGVAFDPTQQKDPDVHAPAEERPIGGLGIFMMKKLSKAMRYERVEDWNRLLIEKNLLKPILSPKT